MIRYYCERCKTKLESPSELAGKQDKCPLCGHVCTVPSPKPHAIKLWPIATTSVVIITITAVAILVLRDANSMQQIDPNEFSAKSAPLLENRPEIKRPVDMTLGNLSTFKPFLDDFGGKLTSKGKTPAGRRFFIYTLDEAKALGGVTFELNEENQITKIDCMFGIANDVDLVVRFRSAIFPVIVARLCKNWDDQKQNEFAQAITNCFEEVTNSQEDNAKAKASVFSNGITAKIFYTKFGLGNVRLERTNPASKELPQYVYEPTFKKEESSGNKEIGISGIKYRLVDQEYGHATVGWQVRITNNSTQAHAYYIKCSFRDAKNFEVAWSNHSGLVIQSGKSQNISEQAMMKSSIWRQIKSVVITVQPIR